MRTILVVLIAFLALAAGVVARSRQNAPPAAVVADLATVSYPDLDGRVHRLDEWKGKVLVVNFWATWCPPCLEEMPAFVKLQEEFAGRGLQFVGIAIDDADSVRDFLKTKPVNYQILIGEDGGEAWAASLGNHAHVLPFSAVFDRSGKLIHVQTGAFPREEVVKVTQPLLEPASP